MAIVSIQKKYPEKWGIDSRNNWEAAGSLFLVSPLLTDTGSIWVTDTYTAPHSRLFPNSSPLGQQCSNKM
jgi:hypothetical protein